MSKQVSHMGDGSEQAGGSGEHKKGSVCGDGAESQEVFMEQVGRSLGQEPTRHSRSDATQPRPISRPRYLRTAPLARCRRRGESRAQTLLLAKGAALFPRAAPQRATHRGPGV